MALPWWWFPAALSTLIALAFLNPDLAAPNGQSQSQLSFQSLLMSSATGSLHLRWLSRHIIMRALFFTTGLSVPYTVCCPYLHVMLLIVILVASGFGSRSQELDPEPVHPIARVFTRSRHSSSHHSLPCFDIHPPSRRPHRVCVCLR